MKKGINNYLQLALVACMIIVSISIAGCGDDHKGHDHGDMNKQETKVDLSIIRTGVIDLQSLDLNNDGMLYQDPMDWNVISDQAGTCPLCKMELKEVSLEKAKDNLHKNNYQVK